jgi:hypothetical protein
MLSTFLPIMRYGKVLVVLSVNRAQNKPGYCGAPCLACLAMPSPPLEGCGLYFAGLKLSLWTLSSLNSLNCNPGEYAYSIENKMQNESDLPTKIYFF